MPLLRAPHRLQPDPDAPDFHLKFAGQSVLDSRVTFTRSSSGTHFDAAGVLQTPGNDVARFDHDLATGIPLGLFAEMEQRTGSALHNRDFTNVVWAKSNLTALKDATGIDGSVNSASTLTATAANGTALQTVTISSAAFTFAIYVKRKTGTGDIDITDNNGTNWTTLTGLSSSDWTRHSITRTQANPVIGFRIVTDTDEIEVDYAGLENGSFPTSAIATTTGTVTRSAEVATVSDIRWFNEDGGTLFLKASVTDSDVTGVFVDIGNNSDAGDEVKIDLNSNKPQSGIRMDSSLSMAKVAADTVGTSQFEAIMSYDAASGHAAVDGSLIGSEDTSIVLVTGLDEMAIGDRAGASNILQSGHIAEIKYWRTRKPNGFLTRITA